MKHQNDSVLSHRDLVVTTTMLAVLLSAVACSGRSTTTGQTAEPPAPGPSPATTPGGPVATKQPPWLVLSGPGAIRAVAQVGDAVWAATHGGLVRYGADGAVRFLNRANSTLPATEVFALASDDAGGLWVGYAQGVAHLQGERWTTYALPDLTGFSPAHLAVDATGQLFAASRNRVARLDGSGWRPVGDDFGWINDMVAGADGAVWIATRPRQTGGFYGGEPEFVGGGLARAKGEVLALFDQAQHGVPQHVQSIAAGRGGALHLLVKSEGATRLLSFDGTSTAEVPTPFDLASATDIISDATGAPWVIADGSLHDRAADTWRTRALPTGAAHHLQAVDAAGHPWVSANVSAADKTVALQVHDGTGWHPRETANSSLSTLAIEDLAIDAHDNIWLATADRGLLVLERGQTRWRVWDGAGQLANSSFVALDIDSSDRVWAINRAHQLARITNLDQPAAVWSLPVKPTLGGASRLSLDVGCDGHAWIGVVQGSDGGLAHFDGQRWEFFNHERLPTNHSVVSVDCRTDLGVWFGTLVGNVVSLRDGGWTTVRQEEPGAPGPYIQSVAIDRRGAVWAGHMSISLGGLSLRVGGAWTAIDLSPFGTEPSIGAVVISADRGDGVWFVADGQLGHVDATKRIPATAEPSITLPGARAIATDSRGNTWVASRAEVAVYRRPGVAGLAAHVARQTHAP